jgi:hypothetical protein
MSESTSPHPRASQRRRDITEPIRWLRNRSLPLLVVTVLTLVAHPFFDVPGQPTPVGIAYVMAGIPLFGLFLLGRYPKVIAAITLVCLGVFVIGLRESGSMEVVLDGWVGLVNIVLYLSLIVLLGAIVFKSTALVDDRVYGGIAVYLLLAIVFSFIHHRIGSSMTGAYASTADPRAAPLNWADYLYFSFTVFTTTGFGDIVPTNAFSRCASSLEGVIGVLFPAVLIARLINRDFAPRA